METRSMTKNNISVEDKEVATVLVNLQKDNNILKNLKKDKEEKDERIVLCRLNEEGERMRKDNIMKEIILEKAYDRIITLDKQNVSIDKDSFLKKNDIKNSPMIYTQLFQGNSKRVNAKIVSKIPKRGIEILARVM